MVGVGLVRGQDRLGGLYGAFFIRICPKPPARGITFRNPLELGGVGFGSHGHGWSGHGLFWGPEQMVRIVVVGSGRFISPKAGDSYGFDWPQHGSGHLYSPEKETCCRCEDFVGFGCVERMRMNLPKSVTIVEVGPRDGLQNEGRFVPTDQKIELIERLSETGLRRIEITSFVHPKAIPQLQDSEEVVKRIHRKPGIIYSTLVPNEKGLERALVSGVKEIALFVSASGTHNQKNVRMSIEESLKGFRNIAVKALAKGIRMRGYVVTAFGCPYEGKISPEKVESIIEEYQALGIHEIVLGDTTGMANPVQVNRMVGRIKPQLGEMSLALHFHNTRGAALANVLAALQEGVTVFDGSIGGLGGCPYAPGASGNVATEDLVNMLEEIGIETGIDLQKLVDCARYAREIIQRDLPSHLLKAGRICWEGLPTPKA
jgi:hydroxymethylglutaryl-CoA lyase